MRFGNTRINLPWLYRPCRCMLQQTVHFALADFPAIQHVAQCAGLFQFANDLVAPFGVYGFIIAQCHDAGGNVLLVGHWAVRASTRPLCRRCTARMPLPSRRPLPRTILPRLVPASRANSRSVKNLSVRSVGVISFIVVTLICKSNSTVCAKDRQVRL